MLDGARRRRLRGLTLLAATIALGAGAAGWALLAGAPAPAKPRPFPPAVAVVPTSSIGPSPSAEPESTPTSSAAPAAPDETRPVVVTEGDGQGAGATWQAAGTLATARYLHTATRLEDGRVLVTGGMGPDGAAIAAAELWDPATRTFSPAGSLAQARYAHAATLLHDGRVLIVGGASAATVDRAEIWDPATGAFEATSAPIRAQGVTATTLQDGRVLIVGGSVCQVDKVATPPSTFARCHGDVRATWIWSPDGTLVAGPELNDERGWHTATLLADGRVLIVGNPQWGSDTPESAEVYDPATNTFSVVGEPRHYISGAQAATLLRDGRVLVSGGDSADPNVRPRWFGPLRSTETWDPASGAFSGAGPMELERRAHQSALLPDGRVLVAGGTGVRTNDFIDPSTPRTEVWDPTTSSFAGVRPWPTRARSSRSRRCSTAACWRSAAMRDTTLAMTSATRSAAPRSSTSPRRLDRRRVKPARGTRAGGAERGCQSTTMPNGAPPPGIETGEPASSVSDVPSTAKALTVAAPASTTYRKPPSGETCASKGRRPSGFERRGADERELAVAGDGVTRDRRRRRC